MKGPNPAKTKVDHIKESVFVVTTLISVGELSELYKMETDLD